MIARRVAALVLVAACAREAKVARTTTRDDLGRDVALPAHIARVVTLAPNVTEMLFALGAGNRIVGTDDFSNFPVAARALPKVGGMQPNLERIASLKPDVVFASSEGNLPNLGPAFANAGLSLFVVRTDRVNEIAPAMRRLASLLHIDGEAAARELEARIAAQKRTRTKPPRVMFAVWTDPLYVAGRQTFTDDLIALGGAQNAVHVTGWPQYSLESFAQSPPDVLLYPRGAVTQTQVDKLLERAGVHPRVVAVDEDIFQRPGPRVVEAATRLNDILSSE